MGVSPRLTSVPVKVLVTFTSCEDGENQLTGLHEASGASWSSVQIVSEVVRWGLQCLWACVGGRGAAVQAQVTVGVRAHLRAGGSSRKQSDLSPVPPGLALAFILENSFKPESGSRPGIPKIGILITDGKSQDDVIPPAQTLRDAGIEVFAIGTSINTDIR